MCPLCPTSHLAWSYIQHRSQSESIISSFFKMPSKNVAEPESREFWEAVGVEQRFGYAQRVWPQRKVQVRVGIDLLFWRNHLYVPKVAASGRREWGCWGKGSSRPAVKCGLLQHPRPHAIRLEDGGTEGRVVLSNFHPSTIGIALVSFWS